MLAVFGLGNPPSYNGTRHNIGKEAALSLKGKMPLAFKSAFADIYVRGGKALIIGKTYMNESGLVFRDALRKLKISPEDILVICDDFNMDLGKLRYRVSGSSGGHNGIESVIEKSGTVDFPRLRLGIGPPVMNFSGTSDWVLENFEKNEKDKAEALALAAADFVKSRWGRFWPEENGSFNV
ncbi:MAG: aminoacyl-tRNA hydrolase [Elusimicrobiota bacterium]|nr:aminoacyl-tRNA hydrolase [Elusimicrobiota bacterium]